MSVVARLSAPAHTIRNGLRLASLILLLSFPPALYAQQPTSGETSDTLQARLERSVRVFLDCRRCYKSYVRRNLAFVDYVRDRAQADVHVLATRRRTGGGGLSYRLEFIGRGPFEGLRYELSFDAPPTATQDERRRGFTAKLRMGLVPFVSKSPAAEGLSVSYDPTSEASADRTPEEDPWNQWVFDIGTSGNFNLQEKEYAYELEGNLEAERTTKAWKLNIRLDGEKEVDVFEREDAADIRSTSENYDFDANVIKTLGPKSGTGVSATVYSRTFTNIQVASRLRAAVEYNLFPYSISDQKELTFTYRIGPEYRNYRERTIFGRWRQTLVQQSGSISLGLNQPWGSVFARVRASNYFYDLTKNSVEFRSYVDVRLVEGLSLRLSLNAERIRDQISLSAGDLSEEEVLLRRQQRATNFELGGSIGLSYTFGSIYNNVVNTRL